MQSTRVSPVRRLKATAHAAAPGPRARVRGAGAREKRPQSGARQRDVSVLGKERGDSPASEAAGRALPPSPREDAS